MTYYDWVKNPEPDLPELDAQTSVDVQHAERVEGETKDLQQ